MKDEQFMKEPNSTGSSKTGTFSFIAKVKPGRGKDIRRIAAERDKISWEDTDKLLRPLTLHYARWSLFDNDTRFIYTAIFDTPLDKYLDDAATIFAQSGEAGFFPHLESFPDDQAAMRNPQAFRKFFAETGVDSFYQFAGYPGASVEEVKKALKVRNAFSNMLDEMQ
jgi:hypothetical protein